MDIHRRGFLGLFGALALDPEKLLWKPDAKKIFIPKPSNYVITWDLYLAKAFDLAILHDETIPFGHNSIMSPPLTRFKNDFIKNKYNEDGVILEPWQVRKYKLHATQSARIFKPSGFGSSS